jgi:short-subunit dehydrogenase
MELSNKVVIVTGASSGIGLATAKLLAKQGAKLVLVARSKDKLDALAKELPGSIAIQTDMSVVPQIKSMVRKTVEHFGRIDVLVNNAGQGYDAPIERINLDTYHRIFDLDVVGPLAAIQEVVPLMRKQGGGAIVNISSATALASWPNMGGYSSLKRALIGISLTAGEELKKDKIAVSVVYPYATATNFEANTIKDSVPESDGELPYKEDTAEHVAERILYAIKSGDAEVYAHEWMKKIGKE